MAQWILAIVALMVVVYNTVITHVVLKNDVRHLAADVKEMKAELSKLIFHLLEKESKYDVEYCTIAGIVCFRRDG